MQVLPKAFTAALMNAAVLQGSRRVQWFRMRPKTLTFPVQVLTKAFTAALMNAAGDIFAQLFVEKNSEIDWKRLGTFTLLVRPRPRTF